MLNIEKGKDLVQQHIGAECIVDSLTLTTEWGWVFFYGTIEKTKPVMVDMHTEAVINIGNGPIEEYIKTYTIDRDEIIRQVNEKKSI